MTLLLLLACRTDKDLVDTGPPVEETGPVDLDGDGWVAAEDCDDADPSVHPDAVEVCNGVDDDCDGQADDAAGGLWYADADGDGFGDPATETQSCDGSSGQVADATDCDDADPDVNLAADELCNGVDDDCDGATDEDAIDDTRWYADADGDGWGGASWTDACEAPDGAVSNDEDCDDEDASVHPDAVELCDGVDNDCDGDVDPDDSDDAATWYADADDDGEGSAHYTTRACAQPSGYVANDDDCDDLDEDANTGASESCDEVDNDCDGFVDEGVTSTWYLDADGDGYGVDTVTAEACTQPTGFAGSDGDCDDADAAYNPGAIPGCDGEDYDCDGSVDNDADGDGYADASCGGDDCDDADNTVQSCESCQDWLTRNSGATSGTYPIDPDGSGVIDVSCDMSHDGGGWTLVFHAYDLGSFDESDFIALYGHNLWTDESWTWDGATLSDGILSLESLSSQGMIGASVMDGLWDDLRMSCSQSSNDATESSYAQVDGYASTNGSWALLGAASNGTAYAVDSALNSVSQSTIWHDNEPNSSNSGHYLCDYTSSGSPAAQFGWCYTDFLTNYNHQTMGDSIVSLAFGTTYGSDSWSPGFTGECGDMGSTALQNEGTFSIWVR